MSLEPDRLPRRDPAAEARSAARRTAEGWRGGGAAIGGIAVVVFLMGAFIVLDYTFDQDPHRIFKVALGLLAFGGIVLRPRFGLLLLPVVTPFLLWVPPTPIPGLNALNVLMFSVFGSYAFMQVMAKRPVLRSGRLGLAIGLLLLICGLSIIRGAIAPTGYGYNPGMAGLVLFRSAVTFAPYFVVLAMVRDAAMRQRVTWAVLVGLLLESLVTIKLGRNGAGGRALGSIGQSNELGAYLALFAVLAASVMIGVRAWYGKLFAAAVFVAGCFGIMLSLSRGSMLALLGGLAVVAWRSSRWVFAIMVVALLASPLWVPDYVKDRITSSKVETEGADEATIDAASEIRILTWRAIFELVEHHPLDGVGFAGLQYVLPDMGEALGLGDVKDSAHNTYLRSLGEMGIFGLVLFLAILWKVWKLGDAAAKRVRRPFDRAIAVGLCGSVVAMSISCAFGDRFWSPVVVSSFWIVAGLVEDAYLEAVAPVPPGAKP